MKVQLLTFRANTFSQSALVRQSSIIGLAVADFPGVVTSHCITSPERAFLGGVIVWEDELSLARFRHSELYARLMLDPHFDDPSDQELAVPDEHTSAELILAA